MALLDLRHALDRAVEFVECCRARVGQLDLHEGDVTFTHPFPVDDGRIAADVAVLLQTPHASLHRRLRQADDRGQFAHGKAPSRASAARILRSIRSNWSSGMDN